MTGFEKRRQILKRILPAVPLALGLVGITAATHMTSAPQAAKTSSDAAVSSDLDSPGPTPAATVAPDLTVNGHHVPLDSSGNADMTLPGNTHVQVSNGQANVSAHSNNSSNNDGSSGGNVNVHVDSDSSGGNSHSTLNVTGSSTTSNGSTHSSSSTHVFSTGSAHVDITP
jgi:hypothetical protein